MACGSWQNLWRVLGRPSCIPGDALQLARSQEAHERAGGEGGLRGGDTR